MHTNLNLDYIYTQHIKDVIGLLDKRVKEIKTRKLHTSKHDIIVFSMGSWPHSFSTLKIYKRNLNMIFETLRHVKQDPKLSDLRLVFWTPPSVPDGIEFEQRMCNAYEP